jgi:hypothetical protein
MEKVCPGLFIVNRPTTTDYGRMMAGSLILCSPKYIPNPNRYSFEMSFNLSFCRNNGLLIENHGLWTQNEKMWADSSTANTPNSLPYPSAQISQLFWIDIFEKSFHHMSIVHAHYYAGLVG